MKLKRGNNEGSIVKRSDGRWQASMPIGRDAITGKPKRAYFYGQTRAEAADKLSHAMSDLRRGVFVEPHKMAVGYWLQTWLMEYARQKVQPLTFDSYETMVRTHLIPALGHIPLRDLQPHHIQRIYNLKLEGGLSGGTIHTLHTVLHAALKQAVRVGLVMRNASDGAVLPRKKPREIHPLTLDQVRYFLAATKQDRMFPAIFLALGTGLRRGELLAMRWCDIEMDEGILHVRQSMARAVNRDKGASKKTSLLFHAPKTDSSRRTIPIPADIVSELKAHRARQAQEKLLFGRAYQDHGLIFCEPDGRPIDPRTFTRRFARLLQQVGLPRIRVHDGRHTFATLMLELGESPKTVQVVLGRVCKVYRTPSHKMVAAISHMAL